MKNKLTIDIDTERKEPGQVMICKDDELPASPKEAAKEVLTDMGCLCEAVVTLIRLAENMGIKSGPDCLRDCIEHITDGFVDPDYHAFLTDREPGALRKAAEEVIRAKESDSEQGSHELNNAHAEAFAKSNPALCKALSQLEEVLGA